MNINSRTSKVNFIGYASGAIASFTGLRAAPVKIKSNIDPIQPGSGDPAPDNIRPIIGVSECNAVRCGVNLWDEQWEVGIYNWNGTKGSSTTKIRSKNFIPCSPNTTYYIVAPKSIQLFYYDASKDFIRYQAYSIRNATFTTPANAYYMTFFVYSDEYGTTYNHDISINYPATDHDYHAYTGNTYTIQLGDTYYGGSLDVITGVLTVTHEMVDLGTLEWQYSATYKWFNPTNASFPAANVKSVPNNAVADIKCTIYEPTTRNDIANDLTLNEKCCVNNGGYFIVRDLDYDDTNLFKSAMNGVKLVYELATPITVQLTPTQVEQIIGTNNIFSDAGNVEVYYVTI